MESRKKVPRESKSCQAGVYIEKTAADKGMKGGSTVDGVPHAGHHSIRILSIGIWKSRIETLRHAAPPTWQGGLFAPRDEFHPS